MYDYVRSLYSLQKVVDRRSDCNPITPNKEILNYIVYKDCNPI